VTIATLVAISNWKRRRRAVQKRTELLGLQLYVGFGSFGDMAFHQSRLGWSASVDKRT